MQRIVHKVEIVTLDTDNIFINLITNKISEEEKMGWEHYDTMVSPFLKVRSDIYLFFKKPVIQNKTKRANKDTEKIRTQLRATLLGE